MIRYTLTILSINIRIVWAPRVRINYYVHPLKFVKRSTASMEYNIIIIRDQCAKHQNQ